MAIAIDRELAGDINNPTIELLNFCIEEHEKELPRLQMLFDYYEGNPHKKGETPTNLPHDRGEVFVNNAKYVTDMMVGFTVGAPISYAAGKGKNIDDILNVFDKIRIRKHDKELAKGLSAMGVGYELHYLSLVPGTETETIPNITWIDPRGMILVVDDTVDRNKLFAIRPVEKQNPKREKFWEIQVYTAKGVFTYRSKTKKLSETDLMDKPKYKEHFYQAVPVVEFRNNEEKQGDYEQQLSQIDKYNLLQTDRIRDKENFIKAIMVTYGFSLDDSELKSSGGSKYIEAPSKEEGAAAEFIANTFDESGVQVLAESLLDDFHKSSYVPNLNDEQFSGNVSGEAMKYKLFGLLLVLSIKTGYMEDGILQRLQLLQNVLRVKGKNVDIEGVTIKFKPNLPINRSDIINQIRDSQEFIPLLISLGWLDDIDNPAEVLELLEEQKLKSIEINQKAMGTQAEDSHSELDEEPDEEEDEDEIT